MSNYSLKHVDLRAGRVELHDLLQLTGCEVSCVNSKVRSISFGFSSLRHAPSAAAAQIAADNINANLPILFLIIFLSSTINYRLLQAVRIQQPGHGDGSCVL